LLRTNKVIEQNINQLKEKLEKDLSESPEKIRKGLYRRATIIKAPVFASNFGKKA
jgi:hypothetical protein